MKNIINFYFLFGVGLCLSNIPVSRADPKEVEVWFLSELEPGAQLIQFLKGSNLGKLAFLNTDPIHLQCVTFGDFYFHPQLGVHDHKSNETPVGGAAFGEKETKDKKAQTKEGNENIPDLADWEKNLIQCDKNYYFDFFCGEARTEKFKESPLEIWIDVSSSMAHVDRTSAKGECFRKSFFKRLKSDCPEDSLSLKIFTTSLKGISQDNYLCQEHGLNDGKRMIDWIKSSNVKKLLIITDIFELTPPLTDYLYSIGATFVGENPSNKLKGQDMLNKLKNVAKFCQNNNDKAAKNK